MFTAKTESYLLRNSRQEMLAFFSITIACAKSKFPIFNRIVLNFEQSNIFTGVLRRNKGFYKSCLKYRNIHKTNSNLEVNFCYQQVKKAHILMKQFFCHCKILTFSLKLIIPRFYFNNLTDFCPEQFCETCYYYNNILYAGINSVFKTSSQIISFLWCSQFCQYVMIFVLVLSQRFNKQVVCRQWNFFSTQKMMFLIWLRF
eukprot:TRINITY_DN13645_c0_g1_i4.p1 TRINITY_DN13645_c0_g1~~TRINITY_DN13645_c0_g1_i4.p1  ORF type:complete len:201 (-),score=-11.65 TRINITY_DN13645_c0_g1_i4:254-856(-)